VFGLHGVGGIVGAILVGVFANPDIGGAAGYLYGDEDRVIAQLLSVVVTIGYSGVATFVILVVLRGVIGLRVDPYVEYWGLDLAHHGESIHEFEAHLPKKLSGTPKKAAKIGAEKKRAAPKKKAKAVKKKTAPKKTTKKKT